MADEQDQGLTGAMNASMPILMAMVAFLAISLYNIIELNVIIFATFKRRAGLYFWSFIVATWGIGPHAVGFILKFFALTSAYWLPCTLVGLGWIAMVTGQSFVLYSRLHLVVQSARRIRWALYMIIFDAVAFHIPVMILAFGANSPNPTPFVGAYAIWDKIQIAVFFVQESILSVLYIYETIRLLGSGGEIKKNPLRQLLAHLLLVNIVVLVLDIILLGIQYLGYFGLQTTFKTAVYSIKLKMEFSVLNRLVAVVQNKSFSGSNTDNNLWSLNTLVSNNATQVNSLGGNNHGGSIRLENAPSIPKDDLRPRVKTTELAMEGGEAGNRN